MAASKAGCEQASSGYQGYARLGVALLLATFATAGCARATASSATPPPTYIPQPTPDATMAAIVQGGGLPVTYLPPLEIRTSPTPGPGPVRPASSGGSGGAPKPAAKPAQPTRDTSPAREPAPAPAVKPAAPREPAPASAPAAKPTAAPAPAPKPAPANTGGAPAIINPNTALPGGARLNPTPAR